MERIAPRLVSVLFGGEALRGFPAPAPTAHIKLMLPDADGRIVQPVATPEGLTWPDGPPTMRTYTPRRYDEAANTLEVQFVLHGEGPASSWAEQATPGDRAAIGGPGGRFALDPEITSWWIGGDESALPAVATLIEALPVTATAEVHLEVDGPEDHVELPRHAGVAVTWHDRSGSDASRWGGELFDALRAAELAERTHVWCATEATAVRRVRSHLLAERSLAPDRITTRGYWRIGEVNHPDHDYGED